MNKSNKFWNLITCSALQNLTVLLGYFTCKWQFLVLQRLRLPPAPRGFSLFFHSMRLLPRISNSPSSENHFPNSSAPNLQVFYLHGMTSPWHNPKNEYRCSGWDWKLLPQCSTILQSFMIRSSEQVGFQPWSHEFKVDQYQLDMFYDHWKSEGI
jgi:hypothetical protein